MAIPRAERAHRAARRQAAHLRDAGAVRSGGLLPHGIRWSERSRAYRLSVSEALVKPLPWQKQTLVAEFDDAMAELIWMRRFVLERLLEIVEPEFGPQPVLRAALDGDYSGVTWETPPARGGSARAVSQERAPEDDPDRPPLAIRRQLTLTPRTPARRRLPLMQSYDDEPSRPATPEEEAELFDVGYPDGYFDYLDEKDD